MAQYFLVAGIAQGYLIEVVALHEPVEHIGAEHHGLGYRHLDAFALAKLRMALYYVVEEGQSAAFSAKRAVADTCKVGVAVELSAVEHGHDAYVLHVAILHNGLKDNLAVKVNILQLVPRNVLQKLRNGEYRPGTQPSAHVVSGYVIEHRVVRYLEDVVLQLLQRAHAHHFLVRLRVAEYEVAEAHVLLHESAQVEVHLL